jgi:pimeloyl-ACP methyl ester carboxylesterase
MQELSQHGRVIAYDRTGFGLSERPTAWEGQNPYGPEAQVDLLTGLLDYYGIEKAILVGNSAGGTVAIQAALAYPERVSALILADPAVYTGGGPPGWVKPLLGTPQMRRLGPLVVRQMLNRSRQLLRLAWHNPALLSDEMIGYYQKPFQVENWDKALWEFTLASQPPGLAEHLEELTLPVLVITGEDDRIVPAADSIRLAGELPNADLEVINEAGHVPQEEQPLAFMQVVERFLDKIQPKE